MIKLSRKKLLIFTSLIFALANTGIFLIPTKWVTATAITNVTYCHRDTNVNQPYGPSSITTDGSSIMRQGHDDHKGPIASSLAIAQALKDDHEKWGDIIPPFNYYDHDGHLHYFEGLNYTSTGQAMIANNCQYVSTVSPAAVTWVDELCEASTYTIPTTTGVIYKVDGVTKAAGTYDVSADITLNFTAVAASTAYKLSGTTSWSHTFTAPNPSSPECVQGAEEVTPDEVVFNDANCDVFGSYVIPSKTGVKYYIGDEVVAAGTYNVTTDKTIKVTAIAEEGYIFPETAETEWSHNFVIPSEEECTEDEEVTPTEVTFTDATCDISASYTIPSKTGVKYYIGDEVVTAGKYNVTANKTITITAVAEEGYFIPETATSEWSHTFDIPTTEECVQGAQSVTPLAVTFTAPTCDALGYYTVPSMTGVKYMVNGQVVAAGKHTAQNGTTVTVTAVAADEFYSIKEGATNQWSYTFTAPTNCVLGTTTPSTLPLTSGSSNTATVIILSSITTAVIVAGAILRRMLVKQL